MSTRSHLVSDAALGPVTNSEISYAQQLMGSAPDDSLTLFDRGFISAELFTNWHGANSNSHWLTPIKAKMRYEIVESHTEYDHLIDMPVSPQAQKQAVYLGEKWQARLILIPTPKGEIKGFITSCLCPKRYPFDALVKVYWERWEIERSYSKLKQYQLQNKPTLRSKKKVGVYQELWGILISYNIVRLEMAEIAKQHQVEPLRISFINALFLIMDEMLWASVTRSSGAIPKNLKALRNNVKRLILPKKRKRKPYPRAVLKKPARYPNKYTTRS